MKYCILLLATALHSLLIASTPKDEQDILDGAYAYATQLRESLSRSVEEPLDSKEEIFKVGLKFGELYREGLQLKSREDLTQEETIQRHRQITEAYINNFKQLRKMSDSFEFSKITHLQSGFYKSLLELSDHQLEKVYSIFSTAYIEADELKLNKDFKPSDPDEMKEWFKNRRILSFTTSELILDQLNPDQLEMAYNLKDGISIFSFNFGSEY